MRIAHALLVVGFLAACTDPSWEDDWRPPASSPIAAPAVYATWWSEVAACLGLSDEGFERVAWYKVGDEHVFRCAIHQCSSSVVDCTDAVSTRKPGPIVLESVMLRR